MLTAVFHSRYFHSYCSQTVSPAMTFSSWVPINHMLNKYTLWTPSSANVKCYIEITLSNLVKFITGETLCVRFAKGMPQNILTCFYCVSTYVMTDYYTIYIDIASDLSSFHESHHYILGWFYSSFKCIIAVKFIVEDIWCHWRSIVSLTEDLTLLLVMHNLNHYHFTVSVFDFKYVAIWAFCCQTSGVSWL